jgi:hypothetical protein
MHELNLWAAWIGIFLGMGTGSAQGLLFHQPQWLGGYGSWRRRLMRLGHISFFGLAFVNLAFFLTVDRWRQTPPGALPTGLAVSSWLLIAGAVLMPTICFLSAWRDAWRRFFFLPVGCLMLGVLSLLLLGIGQ